MPGLFLSMIAVGSALLYSKKQYWFLSLAGACGFILFYIILIAGIGICYPSMHTQWTLENLWDVNFLGFPLEEYIWAFGFGAVFPLIMASSLRLEIFEYRSPIPV